MSCVNAGFKAEHLFSPVVSAAKVNFTQFISSSGRKGLSPLTKAHGQFFKFSVDIESALDNYIGSDKLGFYELFWKSI